MNAEINLAYAILAGRLGSGDSDTGKALKVQRACEEYVLTEDELPDEFDSENYSLSHSVAALVKQRDEARADLAAFIATLPRCRCLQNGTWCQEPATRAVPFEVAPGARTELQCCDGHSIALGILTGHDLPQAPLLRRLLPRKAGT